MRRSVARTAALAALLALGISAAFAGQAADEQKTGKEDKAGRQKGKPGKGDAQGLTDMLAEALKNNPDIRVAEAKLQEAEAELNRTRLQVTQTVMTLYHEVEANRAQVRSAEADLRRLNELGARGAAPQANLALAESRLLKAKADLAKAEAQLPYLLGKPPLKADRTRKEAAAALQRLLYLSELTAAQRAWSEKTLEIDPNRRQWLIASRPRRLLGATEKLRKALDTPVSLDFSTKVPLRDVLNHLEDKVSGISFRVYSGGDRSSLIDTPVELRLKQRVPLGAALQAIGDGIPQLRFAVRDYGILVTWNDLLPPDALLVHDFWKSSAGADTGKKNPPSKNVRGKITLVSPDWDLVKIDLGSDDGLRKGQTLEVVRLRPKAVYLGTVRIVLVEAKTAIAVPLGHPKEQLQVGDTVVSRVK
jgi:hypothetical protein